MYAEHGGLGRASDQLRNVLYAKKQIGVIWQGRGSQNNSSEYAGGLYCNERVVMGARDQTSLQAYSKRLVGVTGGQFVSVRRKTGMSG